MKRKDLVNWMQIKLRIFRTEYQHEDYLVEEFIEAFQNSKIYQYNSFALGVYVGSLLWLIGEYLISLL